MSRSPGRGRKFPIDDAIRDIYGSLSEEIGFEQILHRLGAVFRSTISGLHSEDFGAHRGRLALAGDVTPEEYVQLTESYAQRWRSQNLWMQRSLESFQTQGFQHGDAVVSQRELSQSPYYRHFLKPLDIRYGLGIHIWSGEGLDMAVASFHRGHRETGFDAQDIAIIDAVRPHMMNAYAIYRRIARLERRIDSLRAGFDNGPLGIVAFDGAGHVLEINARAEECLLADGLAALSPDRILLFSHPQVRQAFDAALGDFAQADAKPATLALRDVHGSPADIALHLCRVPSGALSGFDGRARVLAFVAELRREHHAQWAEIVIRTALGLTRAEARVALALLQQPDTAAVAAALGLSAETVRTHIKTIHARLGVKRSADMLLILDRLLGAGSQT